MLFLRQSTASQEVLLGPFVDKTDGSTAETALTIANTDIKIWVEGATVEFNKTSGGATHIAGGRYYTVLDATDTATVGKMEINVHMTADALPVRREFMVLEEAVYDALFASSATGYQVPIWSSAGATVNLSATTVSAVSGAVGSVTGAVGSVTGAVGSVTGNVGGNVVGSVASVVGAVGSVTGNVGGNVTGSVGSLGATAKSDVNAEVLDVLSVDTFAEASSVPAATSTLKDKINWLFALARNKVTQTATTQLVRNDADSGTIGTSTVSDDGTTFTRGEYS